MFAVFVLSVLFFPLLFTAAFNTVFGEQAFAETTKNVSALTMMLGMLCAYALTLYFAKDYFTICRKGLFKDISFIQILLATLYGLLFAIAVVLMMLYIPPPEDFQKETHDLLTGTFFSVGVVVIFTAILAPAIEEFVFRSYIFDSLSQKLSFPVAAVVSSGMFTLPHLPAYYSYWPAVIVIFCLGVLLAYWRKRNESLLPCIVMHASYNSSLLLLFFSTNI